MAKEGVISAISNLLEKKVGYIRVSCLDGEHCEDGFCDAALYINEKDGLLELVTGISVGADFVGLTKFKLKDVQEVDGAAIIITGQLESGTVNTMRLEPKA